MAETFGESNALKANTSNMYPNGHDGGSFNIKD